MPYITERDFNAQAPGYPMEMSPSGGAFLSESAFGPSPVNLTGMGQTVVGAMEFKIRVMDMVPKPPQPEVVTVVHTDSAGNALLKYTPQPGYSGLYKAIVSKPGYQQVTKTLFPVGLNEIELPPEAMPQDYIAIRTSPAIGGVPVRLIDLSKDEMVEIVRTDSAGVARFDNLHPLKDYAVTFHAAGYEPVDTKNIYHNKLTPIVLKTAAIVTLFEIRATFKDTGQPWVGDIKLVEMPSGRVVGEKPTDLRGYTGFSLSVPSGARYVFKIAPDDNQFGATVPAIPKQINRVSLNPKLQDFAVKVSQKETGAPWIGTVAFDQDEPSKRINAKPTDASGIARFLAPAGVPYSFRVPPGGESATAIPGGTVRVKLSTVKTPGVPPALEVEPPSEFPWVPVGIGAGILLIGGAILLAK
jgi:hypothetical protein